MIEYICTICEEIFEEDLDYGNSHGCPYCGNDVKVLQYCEICKAPVRDSKFKFHLCATCEKETMEKFQKFLGDLKTIGQIQYLEFETDGTYWNDMKLKG